MTIDLRKLRVFKNLDELVYDDFKQIYQDGEEPQEEPIEEIEENDDKKKI